MSEKETQVVVYTHEIVSAAQRPPAADLVEWLLSLHDGFGKEGKRIVAPTVEAYDGHEWLYSRHAGRGRIILESTTIVLEP